MVLQQELESAQAQEVVRLQDRIRKLESDLAFKKQEVQL